MPEGFAELHLQPLALARWGLPDLAYPVPVDDLASVLGAQGELPFALLLHGLQQQASDGQAPWRALEPAMDRLANLAAPDDAREVVVAEGDTWWLELGPVDLAGPVVTVQREDCLVAAASRRPDGRLRVATYRPLDARAAGRLIAAAMKPHPEYGVNMRENNWEYLLDASGSFSHMYAAERGESYLSLWQDGLGRDLHGQDVPEWAAQRALAARRAALAATELGVHFMLAA